MVQALLVDSVGGEVQHLQRVVPLQCLGQLFAAFQVETVPRHVQLLQAAVDLQTGGVGGRGNGEEEERSR